MICISEINGILMILIIITTIFFTNTSKTNNEYDNKINLLNKLIKTSQDQIDEKLKKIYNTPVPERIPEKISEQLPERIPEIKNVQHQNIQQYNIKQHRTQPVLDYTYPVNVQQNIDIDYVNERDRMVISDPLYPPLGRTERPIFDSLIKSQLSGLFNYPTRGSFDTFRLIAYLVSKSEKKDMGKNTWKLFGRQKFPGSSIGEYYAIPIDDRMSDLKITIKDEITIGEKIRDIYALPKYVRFKSPMFNDDEYEIIELDKADLTSMYL
jgi:hypothetical protein